MYTFIKTSKEQYYKAKPFATTMHKYKIIAQIIKYTHIYRVGLMKKYRI